MIPMKKNDWIILSILAIIVLSMHVYVALSPAESLITWYSTDDAYYYFKVAQNVVAGHGFTFDQINLTNGFHPLWMFVCIAVFGLFRQDLITPLRALIIVMALLNTGTGIVFYFLLKRKLSPVISGLGAFFWVLFPYIHFITSMHGLESGVSAFFITLFIFVAAEIRENFPKNHRSWTSLGLLGLIGSFVLLSRLDNIFIVAIVGLWIILRGLKINGIVIADIGFSFLSVAASFIARFGFSINYSPFLNAMYFMTGLSVVVNPFLFWLFGLNRIEEHKKFWVLFVKILASSLASTLLVSAGMLYFNNLKLFTTFPRSTLFYYFAFSLIFFGGLRLLIWRRKPVATPRKESFPLVPWLLSRWKTILSEGFIFALPIAIILAGYFAWNHFMFGTLMPISGQIKHWWAILPNTVYSHKVDPFVLMGLSPSLNYGPWSLIINPAYYVTSLIQRISVLNDDKSYIVFFLGLLFIESVLFWLVYRKNKKSYGTIASGIGILPLFIASLLQISYYNATGYPNTRFWYWINELLCSVIFLFINFQLIMDWLQSKRIKRVYIYGFIGIVTIALVCANVIDILSRSSYSIPLDRKEWYLADTKGLESIVPQGSKIGMTGGGTVAYFATNRTIINLDGLMNSVEYFKALKTGAADKFLEKIGMTYIFANEYVITSSDPYMTQFGGHLQRIGIIKGPEMFTLFEFRTGN